MNRLMIRELIPIRFKKHLIYHWDIAYASRPDSLCGTLANFQVSQFSLAHLDRYFRGEKSRHKRCRAFLKAGDAGILIHNDQSLVAYGWMSYQRNGGPPHMPSAIKRRVEFWIHSCYIQPAFRGRGLYPLLLRELCQFARKAGRPSGEDILIDTSSDNFPARRGILAAGFEEYGVAGVMYLWMPKVAMPPLWGTWHTGQPHPAVTEQFPPADNWRTRSLLTCLSESISGGQRATVTAEPPPAQPQVMKAASGKQSG
jgi:GNAT superfamily N-acetyltransferase